MIRTLPVVAARVALRTLLVALALIAGSGGRMPLAAQEPVCEAPPRRLAPQISTRPKRAATPVRKRAAVARRVNVPAKAATRPRPVRRRKAAPRTAVPLPASASMSGAALRGCPAVAPAGPRVALVARVDAPAVGTIALIDELPALLPPAAVEDDSTGVLPIWWLAAAGLAAGGGTAAVAEIPGLVLRGDGRTTHAPAPWSPTESVPLPFAPGPESNEGDPPSVEGPAGPPGGAPGTVAPPPGETPGAPPEGPRGPSPELPPSPVVGSTGPFPYQPGTDGAPPDERPEEEPRDAEREGVLPEPDRPQPPGWEPPSSLTTTTSVVPEPAPLTLLLIGSAVLSLALWKISRRP
ncbi:MAG: hypothetical protein ACXW0Z_00140 [Gemmatirosa sp.]